MENNNRDMQQGQEGSGSAENRGGNRHEQAQPLTDLSQQEKQNIADQIGEDPDAVASLKDLGQLSGRDDASGGINDGMERTSTGEATER